MASERHLDQREVDIATLVLAHNKAIPMANNSNHLTSIHRLLILLAQVRRRFYSMDGPRLREGPVHGSIARVGS